MAKIGISEFSAKNNFCPGVKKTDFDQTMDQKNPTPIIYNSFTYYEDKKFPL